MDISVNDWQYYRQWKCLETAANKSSCYSGEEVISCYNTIYLVSDSEERVISENWSEKGWSWLKILES